jgi:hypothetical protein
MFLIAFLYVGNRDADRVLDQAARIIRLTFDNERYNAASGTRWCAARRRGGGGLLPR